MNNHNLFFEIKKKLFEGKKDKAKRVHEARYSRMQITVRCRNTSSLYRLNLRNSLTN